MGVLLPEGPHPFPFRIRPLSPPGPMVLHPRGCGRVGQCLHIFFIFLLFSSIKSKFEIPGVSFGFRILFLNLPFKSLTKTAIRHYPKSNLSFHFIKFVIVFKQVAFC